MKKILSFVVLLVIVSTYCLGVLGAMSDHHNTVSFPAGGSGYSSYNIKSERATQYSTQLVGVGFIGLPAGMFPNNTGSIYIVPCDYERNYAAVAPRNYHNSTHYNNGTIKHDYYYGSTNDSPDYREAGYSIGLRVYSSLSIGGTMGIKWNLGYVTSFA